MRRFAALFEDPERLLQRLLMAEVLARRGEGPLARRPRPWRPPPRPPRGAGAEPEEERDGG